MPIRAILFDLDGTLIDQFEAIHRAFALTLKSMGLPEPSYNEVKKAVGGASESTMTKLIGQERAKEAVRRLRPIFEKEMLNGLKLLPGAIEILQKCHAGNIRTAVLTNKYGPHARAACDYLKLSEHLQFIIGADDTEWKKPSPNLTSFALRKLGTSSQETLYVGDSPYDYQTAQNVSMPCILLSTGTHSSDELSKLNRNLIIKRNLSEVLPVLNLPNIESPI